MKRKVLFEHVMREHKDAIYSYAYYFSGNRASAEDLTQEILLKIWQNLDSLGRNPGRSWVMTVARNHCIDWSRSRGGRRAECNSLEGRGLHLRDRSATQQDQIERKDLRRRIEAAIAGLPAKIKSLIILREIEDMKYEEISRALDMPMNSVKAYIHRGRRLLREQLRSLYAAEFERR